jgi:hypothetical protein
VPIRGRQNESRAEAGFEVRQARFERSLQARARPREPGFGQGDGDGRSASFAEGDVPGFRRRTVGWEKREDGAGEQDGTLDRIERARVGSTWKISESGWFPSRRSASVGFPTEGGKALPDGGGDLGFRAKRASQVGAQASRAMASAGRTGVDAAVGAKARSMSPARE